MALASLLGTVAGLWLSPPAIAPWLVGGIVLALCIALRRGARATVCLLAAYVWAVVQGWAYLSRLPGDEIRDQDLPVSGCVADFPRSSPDGTTFIFQAAAPVGRATRLYLRSFDPSFVPVPGGCYEFLVRLKPPHGQTNPGQFDRQLWLMAQRVHAVGYLRPGSENRARPDLFHPDVSLHMRRFILERIRSASPDRAGVGLLEGLTVGVRTGIGRAQWDVLRATGTVHLMAISGLHVGLVAGGLWWAGTAWQRRRSAAAGMGPAVRGWSAHLMAGCGALTYAMLAGWSAPTSRAALMFVVLMSLTRHRRVPRMTGLLSVVLLFSVMADPFVVLATGFWMSYLAVLLLVTLPAAIDRSSAERSPDKPGVVRTLLSAQWRLSIGLALPNALLFGALVPLGPLINVFAIPVFSLLVLPVALLSVALLLLLPPVGAALIAPTARMLELCMTVLASLAGVSPLPDDWLVGKPSATLLLAAGCGWLLLPAPFRSGRCAVVLMALIGSAVMVRAPATPLRVNVLDVGQGTAVLIRTSHHAMLLDTGPRWPGGDAGAFTVLPFLRVAGVGALDAVIVSHADSDHSGGLGSVVKGIPVASVFMPQPPAGSGYFRCRRGMAWQWDGVEFSIAHPAGLAGWSDNDGSCVLVVRYKDSRLLFPGDIESAAEQVLASRQPDLTSDLVVVPHHGSKTSSSHRFVSAVQARYAIYTTAFWNRWGFPAAASVQRWSAAGACTLNTAATGALVFVWRPNTGLTLEGARKRYWLRPWPIRPVPDDACLGV